MSEKRKLDRKKLMPVSLLILFILACDYGSCEKRPTVVTLIDRKNPPTFKLSGNGHLWEITMTGAFPGSHQLQNQDGSYVALWEIYTNTKKSSHAPAQELPPITYGVVPAEFKQLHDEKPAPALEEGKFYEFKAHTTHEESDGRGGFKFYNNKFCFTISKGMVEEVPCEEKK